MRIIRVLAGIALTALAVSDAGATCQYAQVADRCRGQLILAVVDSQREVHAIDLSQGVYGLWDVSGVDFSTVPGQERMSFVVQGPFLRVVDQMRSTLVRSLDVAMMLGLFDLEFSRLDAAPPIEVFDSSGQLFEQSALFLVGTRPGPEAWYAVLDQEAVLQGSNDPAQILLGSGPVCPAGETCAGRAIDVGASSVSPAPFAQAAYVTALDNDPAVGLRQVFYQVTRGPQARGPWDVWRADWDDGSWGGFAHRAIGVDFEERGPEAYGILQTGGEVIRLGDGERLCDLPGQPTDIMVWGPAGGIDADNYLFVTYKQGSGYFLTAFPADACPGDPLPSVATVAVGATPLALALSSTESEEFQVFTANRNDGTLSAIRFRMWHDGLGDRLDVEEQSSIDLNGTPAGPACPTHLAIEAGESGRCRNRGDDGPGGTSPPLPRCLDPNDADCGQTGRYMR